MDASREQVLAANIDVAFLVQALPHDFNVRRLERYLAMAWESGAQPIVVLTKTDLVDDTTPYLNEVEAVTLGACPALALSPKTGDAKASSPPSGSSRTAPAVLLGSSGVGKSTIVNALPARSCWQAKEVREGRPPRPAHDLAPQLDLLAAAASSLDTPGIRELQLWDADSTGPFGDVEEIALNCRFSDCNHDQEPGCAVRAALADGSSTRKRWRSVREAATRARGGRAAQESPTATGAPAGVQDPRTTEPTQEETLSPPRVREDAVELAVPDPDRGYQEVVLAQEIVRPRVGPPFEWRDGTWRLDFRRADVDRMEYMLGIDGRYLPDPANPLHARGPFGEKSVIEWPEYEAPGWLDSVADAGRVERLEIRCRRLVARVHVLLYATPDPPGPMRRSSLHTTVEYAGTRADAVSRRDELGGADPAAARRAHPARRPQRDYRLRALRRGARARTAGDREARARQAQDASARARRSQDVYRVPGATPGSSTGLLLNRAASSAAFDKQESIFPRYRRISRFVGTVLHGLDGARPIPVAITCGSEGRGEPRDRVMADARAGTFLDDRELFGDLGADPRWRDAFDPHLPAVIEAAT